MFKEITDQMLSMNENILSLKKEINSTANKMLSEKITIERLKSMHWNFTDAFQDYIYFRADVDDSRDICKIARDAYASIGYTFKPEIAVPELMAKIQFEDAHLQLCFNYVELKVALKNGSLNLPTAELRLKIKRLISSFDEKIRNLQLEIERYNSKVEMFAEVLDLL